MFSDGRGSSRLNRPLSVRVEKSKYLLEVSLKFVNYWRIYNLQKNVWVVKSYVGWVDMLIVTKTVMLDVEILIKQFFLKRGKK